MMLLAAIDIEGCGADVVAVAGQLALDLGLPLTLLYAVHGHGVVPGGAVLPGGTDSVHDRLRDEARAVLNGLAQPWMTAGVAVQVEVRFGTPQAIVLASVEAMQPRFLVLGTHGRVGMSRWLYGSVEESIARRSPVPVVVVPSPGTTTHHTPVHRAVLVEENG